MNEMTKTGEMAKAQDIKSLMSCVNIKKRFEEILGNNAAAFMSGVIAVANGSASLRASDPQSILGAAVLAATLKLPVSPQLGQAHIVPYKNKSGVFIAQFQMGWRGFVQLAIRSGQYYTINCSEVYDGELVNYNHITGDCKFDPTLKKSSRIIGYAAYFKLLNGFEKYVYMTVDEVTAHAKKYSKSFHSADGKWQQDFDAMARKTVIKMILSKWGVLSIEMQTALAADQAEVKQEDGGDFEFNYIDNDTIDAEATVISERPITSTEEEYKQFKAQKEAAK